jgi:hypothetical protein
MGGLSLIRFTALKNSTLFFIFDLSQLTKPQQGHLQTNIRLRIVISYKKDAREYQRKCLQAAKRWVEIGRIFRIPAFFRRYFASAILSRKFYQCIKVTDATSPIIFTNECRGVQAVLERVNFITL